MINRHSGCPLCGGKLSALELLDACDELTDAALGVLAARCPYCQGHLEIRPVAGCIEVGYIVGTGVRRFDVAASLPCAGLEIVATEQADCLQLSAPDRNWAFSAA
jgi:hypothetical protein